jgi:CheY-like chemotaxis protein
VLRVEDDRAVRVLTAKVLRAHGYTVFEAASAEAAEEVLAHNSAIDLVVSDTGLPAAARETVAAEGIEVLLADVC